MKSKKGLGKKKDVIPMITYDSKYCQTNGKKKEKKKETE